MMLIALYLLCLILSFICNIWMLIRIGRVSGLTALLAFFFFPAAILHLVRHWGEEDNDIRTPFFATLAFALLGVFAAHKALTWATNSVQAEQALARSMLSQVGADERDSLDRNIAVAKAQSGVNFIGGKVAFPEAHATLDVPEHFRYGRAETIKPLAEAMGRGLTPGTIGWLVHDKVSFTDRNPWIIEVHWYPLGHVAEGEAPSLAPDQLVARRNEVLAQSSMVGVLGDFQWKGFVYRPEWNSLHGWLAWSESTHYDELDANLVDCYADVPGREGVLRYDVEFLREARGELGFRAVRLMAMRSQFDPGWSSADFSRLWHRKSGFELADLVSGKAYGN